MPEDPTPTPIPRQRELSAAELEGAAAALAEGERLAQVALRLSVAPYVLRDQLVQFLFDAWTEASDLPKRSFPRR